MQKFFKWLFLFLLVFIPLYPKLPLWDVAFTWTYIRIEDLLVALSYVVLVYLLIRKKIVVKNYLLWPIVIFWLIGLVSTVVNIPFLENGDGYVTYKPHLVVFNYLRRIEYLGLLFVAFAAMKTRIKLQTVVWVVIGTLVGVLVYGLGQQYLRWPQFLTMNEEFAKGTPLPLQNGSRLSATFGGHYDFAGYLVLVVPLSVALCFVYTRLWQRGLLLMLAGLGFFELILTSSRISFAAFIIALGVLLFSIMRHKKVFVAAVLALVLITVFFGRSTILDRFSKTVRLRQVNYDPTTTRVLEPPTRNKDWGGLPESDSALLLPFTPVESTSSAYMVFKYKKSEYEKLKLENPNMDVTSVPIPQVEVKENTQNIVNDEIIEEVRLVNGDFQKRWALVFDISATTRVQGGWPIAWRGFLKNPLIGQGYSTVSAASDSSYMRSLGEVGLAGFISFFAILVIFLKKAYRVANLQKELLVKMWILGVSAGVVGLLINGLLIDIFEASKVAFYLWMLIGVSIAVIEKSDTLEVK